MLYPKALIASEPVWQGPLKIVWCAASNKKLNKSLFTSTHISTAAERIMYPAVPMTMRMSSHLLIGIVRIYSEQVESLLRDSNILLINIEKAFSTDRMNPSTFKAVSLPDKFELDALDNDTNFSQSTQDNHVRNPKEITLEDKILGGQDSYMVVSFHQDKRNPPPSANHSGFPIDATLGAEDSGPSNHQRLILLSYTDASPVYGETEIMRDASFQYSSENDLFWPDQSQDRLEPDWVLMKMVEQTEADNIVPAVSPLPTEQHQEPISALSDQGLQFFDSGKDNEYASPTLQIRSSPPPQQTLRKQRRSNQYDHTTILSNKCMNNMIIDSSSILRQRKNFPPDPLGSWKLNKRIKKDAIFFEPLLTGLGSDLCEAYQKDFISGKPYLCTPVNNVDDMEIEHEMSAKDNSLAERAGSPNRISYSQTGLKPSPTGGHDCTPGLGSDTSSLLALVEPTSCNSTPDLQQSAVTPGFDQVTPMVSLKGIPGVEDFGPGNPGFRTFCDGELSFLAEDDNNSPGPQETTPDCFFSWKSEVEPLSARTRAVARFLKHRSSVTPVYEREQSVNVSLKMILEGKRRKVCARMVFETLVLTNYGLVDVQQEESFGDVVVIVTPKLSSELFST